MSTEARSFLEKVSKSSDQTIAAPARALLEHFENAVRATLETPAINLATHPSAERLGKFTQYLSSARSMGIAALTEIRERMRLLHSEFPSHIILGKIQCGMDETLDHGDLETFSAMDKSWKIEIKLGRPHRISLIEKDL